MSTLVMAACWPLQMPPTSKAVLVSLADQCNDQGGCWPSLSTLCERTCLSERTVRSALRWLEGVGVLETARRNKRDGSMSSNFYMVTPSAFRPDRASPEPAATPSHSPNPAPTMDPTPPAAPAPPPRQLSPHPPAAAAP